MTDNKKKKRNLIVAGTIALSCFMGLATVMSVIIAGSKSDSQPSKTTIIIEEINWATFISDKLAALGFGFATASVNGKILSISGDTNDAQNREAAFNAARAAVLNSGKNSNENKISAFENLITINGEKINELPDALSALGNKPEAESCQNAYDSLLQGRVINFNSGSSIITEDSTPLLDALAKVGTKCINYIVEVGGHTDNKGEELSNLGLSEKRAQSVADYLIRNGIEGNQIIAKGYGETMPLDNSNSTEADAKNRRIEFKVSEKQ